MLRMGTWQCVVLNGRENLKSALITDTFSDRPAFKTFSLINEGKSLSFTNCGPAGKVHRKICMKALSMFINSKSFPFEGILSDTSESMCSAIAGSVGKPFVPHEIIRDHTMSIIFKICFGRDVDIVNDAQFRKIRETLHEFNESHKAVAMVDFMPCLEPFFKKKLGVFFSHTNTYQGLVQEKLDAHIAEYDQNEIRDATDALIRSCNLESDKLKQVGLGRREILHSVQDFVAAGSTTTSDIILWMIAYLVLNPDIQDKLHNEVMTKRKLKERVNDLSYKYEMPYMWATILEVRQVQYRLYTALGCIRLS